MIPVNSGLCLQQIRDEGLKSHLCFPFTFSLPLRVGPIKTETPFEKDVQPRTTNNQLQPRQNDKAMH